MHGLAERLDRGARPLESDGAVHDGLEGQRLARRAKVLVHDGQNAGGDKEGTAQPPKEELLVGDVIAFWDPIMGPAHPNGMHYARVTKTGFVHKGETSMRIHPQPFAVTCDDMHKLVFKRVSTRTVFA